MSADAPGEAPVAVEVLLELLHASSSAGSPPMASAAMPACRRISRRVNRIDGASGLGRSCCMSPSSSFKRCPRAGRSWRTCAGLYDVFCGLQGVEAQADDVGPVLHVEGLDDVVVRVVRGSARLQERRSRNNA